MERRTARHRNLLLVPETTVYIKKGLSCWGDLPVTSLHKYKYDTVISVIYRSCAIAGSCKVKTLYKN